MKDDRFYLKLVCEYKSGEIWCGDCRGEVKFRKSMTAYHFEGKKNSLDDPNRQFMACDGHYEEYVAHWRDMWSNVPNGGYG